MLRRRPSHETEQRELRWQRLAPLGLALVVLAASVTLVIRSEVADEPSRRGVPDIRTRRPEDVAPGQPVLIGGERITLNDAKSAWPFPVYRPQHSAASDDSLTEVWSTADELALRYASGVRAYLSVWPRSRIGDAEASYRDWAADTAAEYLEINGFPAMVTAPEAAIENAEGVLTLTVGRVEISLYAYLPPEQLIAIAETVRS